MKEYIKNNLQPLAIGFGAAGIYHFTMTMINDTIIKIIMILNP